MVLNSPLRLTIMFFDLYLFCYFTVDKWAKVLDQLTDWLVEWSLKYPEVQENTLVWVIPPLRSKSPVDRAWEMRQGEGCNRWSKRCVMVEEGKKESLLMIGRKGYLKEPWEVMGFESSLKMPKI